MASPSKTAHEHHTGTDHTDTAYSKASAATARPEPVILAQDEHAHRAGSHTPALHFEHCPFCFTHAGSFGLPPFVFLLVPFAAAAAIMPPLFFQWPGQAFAWTAAQPRGPPSTS